MVDKFRGNQLVDVSIIKTTFPPKWFDVQIGAWQKTEELMNLIIIITEVEHEMVCLNG